MPAPEGFVQSLVDYAEAIEDVTPLEARRDALFARLQLEDGKTLVEVGAKEESFRYQLTMTLEEAFTAYVQAVKRCKGTAVSTTYAAFPRLTR